MWYHMRMGGRQSQRSTAERRRTLGERQISRMRSRKTRGVEVSVENKAPSIPCERRGDVITSDKDESAPTEWDTKDEPALVATWAEARGPVLDCLSSCRHE